MQNRNSLSLVTALWLCALVSCARADKVDDFVRIEMQKRKIPGLSLLILKDDRPVKRTAYGEASLELHVPASPDQLFESGSIGKSFTAVLIMQLVEEGKIALTDPVGKHLKEAPQAWNKITIRHLLSHTSGLKDYALIPGLLLTQTWTTQDWFATMLKQPLDFEPGTAWAYSNTNYFLLGVIAERLLGKDFTDIVSERILKPLGLQHSFYAGEASIIEKRARGYYLTPEGLINCPPITAGFGDGGMVNTADDLAKFEQGFREGKLVKPETAKQMQEPVRLSNGRKAPYGLGWFVRDLYGTRMVSHGGNTAGFSASVARWPKQKLTIVLMCNINNQQGDELARQIAEVYAPELKPSLTESPDPDPAFTQTLRAALTGLANSQTKQEILDPDYAARLTTPRGQRGLAAFAPFAHCDSFAFLHIEPSDPDRIFRYRAHAQGKSYIVAFVVTKQNRIYQVGTRQEA